MTEDSRMLDSSHLLSLMLYTELSQHLDQDSLQEWTPVILGNIERLSETCRGEPHRRNLGRWKDLVLSGDVEGIRRHCISEDVDSTEMREVGPLAGIMTVQEREAVVERWRKERRNQPGDTV